MVLPFAPSVHYTMAAWGAVLLGDAERCERGLTLAREHLLAHGPASSITFAVEEERAVDRTWLALHGAPRPGAP